MIKIHCITNLDVREKWPEELPVRPMVGDLIQSSIHWKQNRDPLELEVIRVTWKHVEFVWGKKLPLEEQHWVMKVELHLPKGRYENMYAFVAWYYELSGIKII